MRLFEVRKRGVPYRGESLGKIYLRKEEGFYEKNEICKAVDCRLVQRSSLLMERKKASESLFQ